MTLDVLRLALALRPASGYRTGTAPSSRRPPRTQAAISVYSEDFSHEQDYDGLRVNNPFADAVPGA